LASQLISKAFRLDAAKAGSNIAAKMAIIAMTTKSSINVKPDEEDHLFLPGESFRVRITVNISAFGVTID
jgi:hypothetical protein